MTNELGKNALGRRAVMLTGLAGGLGVASCRLPGMKQASDPAAGLPAATRAELDAGFSAMLAQHRIPGIAAALIVRGTLAWADGYGWADVENRRRMTARSVQNIGSVTKTVTTTLALQDIEAGRLALDADVNRYLDFAVRNPAHPDAPITVRQLLTHRSSIRDGEAYDDSYRCGDQTGALGPWLRDYFAPSAASDHFHGWAPGTLRPAGRAYSNVAFGLIGYLSQRLGGKPYEDLCRERIFAPLGMTSATFRVGAVDPGIESVPYKTLSADFSPADIKPQERLFARYPGADFTPQAGGHFPFCSYSFATHPDGLMRTSIADLARFVGGWAIGGADSPRLLRAETMQMALEPLHFGRLLGWDRLSHYFGSDKAIPGAPLIGHNGGDPGIGSVALFRPSDGSGLAMFFNVTYRDAIVNDGLDLYLKAVQAA